MLKIGHRGAAALAPANTISSLLAAVAAGVDMVEIDVIAVSGRLLLSHSLREVRGDAPTLDEAIEALPRDLPLLVDVKRRGYEHELVEVLRRHGAIGRAVASTTDLQILDKLRSLEPLLRRSVTYPRSGQRARLLRPLAATRVPLLVRRAEASAATVHYGVLSAALADRCHALGAQVFAWTVNDRSIVQEVAARGADGVITDDPGVFSGPRATLQP